MGTLGCKQHTAYIQDKCQGPRLCELQDINTLGYDRRLDDISEAYVEIPISGDVDDPCCQCLGDIEPWCHLLTIVREGDGVVWSGPVQEVIYGFNTVRIQARDKLAWLTVRINEDFIDLRTNETIEFTTIGKLICEFAMADDDSPCFLESPNGQDNILDLGDGLPAVYPRGMEFNRFDGPDAYNNLISVAEAGMDFTVFNQVLLLMSQELPATSIGTLTDEMILGEISVRKDGAGLANRWFVRYDGDDTDCVDGIGGDCGTGNPCPCPALVEDITDTSCYGLVERYIPQGAGGVDRPSAITVGQNSLARSKIVPRLVDFPSGSRLSPETPWELNQMIPGQRINVALSKLCFPLFEGFKLQTVTVTDGPEGEAISIDLVRLDSTITSQ